MRGLFESTAARVLLIALAGIAAAAATYHFATVWDRNGKITALTEERNGLLTWIGDVCGNLDHIAAPVKAPRDACKWRVRWLTSFHSEATSATTRKLVEAENERVRRLEADNAARARNEQSLKAQLRQLKEASRNVQNDVVGPDYWAAANRVAGLRPPGAPAQGPGAGGGHREPEAPPSGAADLRQ